MPERKICDQAPEDNAAMFVKRPKTEDPPYVMYLCGCPEDIPYAHFLRFLRDFKDKSYARREDCRRVRRVLAEGSFSEEESVVRRSDSSILGRTKYNLRR